MAQETLANTKKNAVLSRFADGIKLAVRRSLESLRNNANQTRFDQLNRNTRFESVPGQTDPGFGWQVEGSPFRVEVECPVAERQETGCTPKNSRGSSTVEFGSSGRKQPSQFSN